MKTLTIPAVFVLLLSFALAVDTCGQDKEHRTSLDGDWRFALGDNKKFARPEYDDSEWEKIYVPSHWQREGFRNYHGYAWYRKKVTIEVEDQDALYLELGKIDDVDEVYFNGHFIGGTGGFPPDYFTAFSYNRRYFIPMELVNTAGKNVIAVRVYDEGGEGGIMGPNVGIYNYRNYSDNSVHLFGKWKFRMADNPKWGAENLDDSDWEDIIVPASWESQGFPHYDGFAWYRKNFTLPSNFNTEEMLIILGKIDDMDQVYINGRLVGRTGNIDRKWVSFRLERTM
jgi:sialate O-acetylesterase